MQANILRYMSFLDGALITDTDERDPINYYGFQRPGGSYVIMRESATDPKHFDYYQGNKIANYSADWTGKAGLIYKDAGDFKHL
jgi:hypothetical protein